MLLDYPCCAIKSTIPFTQHNIIIQLNNNKNTGIQVSVFTHAALPATSTSNSHSTFVLRQPPEPVFLSGKLAKIDYNCVYVP